MADRCRAVDSLRAGSAGSRIMLRFYGCALLSGLLGCALCCAFLANRNVEGGKMRGKDMVEAREERARKLNKLGVRTGNAGKRYPPEALRVDEVRGMMNALSPKSATGRRNRALVATMWRCGLRVSEAVALMPGDLVLEPEGDEWARVFVRAGKGGRSRTVPIDDGAARILDRWMDERERIGLNGSRPVFCTLDGLGKGKPEGVPVSTAYVRALIRRLAEKAGIGRRVTPHMFRHTFAFDLRSEGYDVISIMRLLGHKSLQHTAVYLDHLAPVDLAKKIRKRQMPEL